MDETHPRYVHALLHDSPTWKGGFRAGVAARGLGRGQRSPPGSPSPALPYRCSSSRRNRPDRAVTDAHAVAQTLPHATLRVFPGDLHDVLNEHDRDAVHDVVGRHLPRHGERRPTDTTRPEARGSSTSSNARHGPRTVRSMEELADDDWRKTSPRFMGENFQRNLRIADEVQAIAAEVGATPAPVAIAWLLAKGDDITPIPGTKRVARVEENNAADAVELTAEQIAALDALTPAAESSPQAADADDRSLILSRKTIASYSGMPVAAWCATSRCPPVPLSGDGQQESVRPVTEWSRRSGSNRRPTAYKTVATRWLRHLPATLVVDSAS